MRFRFLSALGRFIVPSWGQQLIRRLPLVLLEQVPAAQKRAAVVVPAEWPPPLSNATRYFEQVGLASMLKTPENAAL